MPIAAVDILGSIETGLDQIFAFLRCPAARTGIPDEHPTKLTPGGS